MASRYWIGGTGNWSDTAHWAATSGGAGGETVPTSSDDVFFDSASASDNYTVTVDASSNCRDFTMDKPTGVGKQVTLIMNDSLNFWGNIDLVGGTAGIASFGTEWAYCEFNTASPSDQKTITTNGVQLNIDMSIVGGIWTLQDDLYILGTDANTIEMYGGTLDANDHNVSSDNVYLGTNDSIIYMGSGTWTIRGTFNNYYPWRAWGEVHAETSTIDFVNSDGSDINFENPTTNSYHIVKFTGSAAANHSFVGSCTIDKLVMNKPGSTVYFETGATYTINNSFEMSGTLSNRMTVDSGLLQTTIGQNYGNLYNNLYSGAITGTGQSFTGVAGKVTQALVGVSKFGSGSPTGNVYLEIYAHSGTFGTSSVPTGAALATSDTVDASTISDFQTSNWFTFSGANQITLDSGTNYVIVVRYAGGDASNYIYSPGAPSDTWSGNAVYYDGSWHASGSSDVYIGFRLTGQHTITKAGSRVSCDHLDLSNSNVTGGAKWYAGWDSVDTTNNDGWVFTQPTEDFFKLFS